MAMGDAMLEYVLCLHISPIDYLRAGALRVPFGGYIGCCAPYTDHLNWGGDISFVGGLLLPLVKMLF